MVCHDLVALLVLNYVHVFSMIMSMSHRGRQVEFLNMKCANKTYTVIARREHELRTCIKRGVPRWKWFAMCIKWRLDSNLLKHKCYSLTC